MGFWDMGYDKFEKVIELPILEKPQNKKKKADDFLERFERKRRARARN